MDQDILIKLSHYLPKGASDHDLEGRLFVRRGPLRSQRVCIGELVLPLPHVSIQSGTLDDPELAPPEGHYGVESWISWLKVDDGLKREETEEDVQR
jgi:hypothetical protein